MSYQLSEVQWQIAALMLAWDNYKTGNTSAEAVENAITYLASKASVETFGTEGEQVPFEPFEHYLIDKPHAVENVVIEIAGIRAIRENGSHKILTRALVKKGEVK